MTLKHRLRALVASGESDAGHVATRLESRLVPEQRDQSSHLHKRCHTAVHIYGLFSLHKVSNVTIVIYTTDIKPGES